MDSKELLIAAGYKRLEFEVATGSYEEVPQLDPDLMHLRFIMCHAAENANGDTFNNEVLQRARYTPKNKPINWEHGQPIIGTMLDSEYKEDAEGVGYIEATGVVWKFIYPEIAEQIKTKAASGGLKLSMECYYKDANYQVGDQIFDQEQAEKMGIIPYVGREYMGKKVARVFKEVIFGAVGVVANPADKKAVFLSVAKDLSNQGLEINEENEEAIAEFSQAISEAVKRTVNDFKRKDQAQEDVDAVAVAKYIKAFDKAKSAVVAKFNAASLKTKEQMLSEVRNTVNTLLLEIDSIASQYSSRQAVASEVEKGIQNALADMYASSTGSAEAYLRTVEEDYITYDLVDYSADSFKTLKAKFICNEELGIGISGVTEINETEVQDLKDQKTEVVEVVEAATETETVEETVETAEATEVVETEEVTVVAEAAKEEEKEEDEEEEEDAKKEKASELDAELESLKQENASLKTELEGLKAKFNEIELEKTLASRLSELKELGIEFSESRLEKESARLKTMTSEDYADHKELLMEIAGRKQAEAAFEEVATASEEVVEEDIVVEGAKATAGLVIETERSTEARPFGHLSR